MESPQFWRQCSNNCALSNNIRDRLNHKLTGNSSSEQMRTALLHLPKKTNQVRPYLQRAIS